MVQTLSHYLQYHFINDEAQLRLQHIAVQQPHEERRSESFNRLCTALPTCDMALPNHFQSDAFMPLNGQSIYSHANVQVEGSTICHPD